MPRQIASPNPIPRRPSATFVEPRTNFSKIASSLPAGIPGPLSAITIFRQSARARAQISIRLPGRRVTNGVAQQVGQHLDDQVAGRPTAAESPQECRSVLRDQPIRAAVGDRATPTNSSSTCHSHSGASASRIQSPHVEQIVDLPPQLPRFVDDRFQHLADFRESAIAPFVEQSLRRHRNRRQRRTQIMRDRGKQRVPQLLRFDSASCADALRPSTDPVPTTRQ